MEIITILLVTKDFDYAETMTTCVSSQNNSIVFTVISDDEFKLYTNYNEFDLILLDYMISYNTNSTIDSYIYFIEKQVETDHTNSMNEIYRYDSADNLINKLTILYCMKSGSQYVRCKNKLSKIVYFCSAEGGTGKTSIALGLAQELTRYHGQNVLYINYEEFETTDRYFERKEDKTLSNFLYYLESNNNLNRLIDAFTISDEYGVKAFSASKGRNQLKILDIQELAHFIDIIQSNDAFDYIIIDGDTSLNKKNLWLISICDKVCKVSRSKNDLREINFNIYLEYHLGKQVYDKMINIVNRCENQEKEEEDTATIYIDVDEKSFSTRTSEENIYLTSIDLARDFGVGIRQLSTNLTLNLH